MRLVLRFLGVRIVESPEVIRATLPRWMVKLGVLNKVQAKLIRDNDRDVAVRIVGRSVIVRY